MKKYILIFLTAFFVMAGMVQANAKEIHLVVDHRNW